jgi:gliding motility-associated-like protein
MRAFLGFTLLISSLFSGYAQCDIEIAGFDPVTLEMSLVVHDGNCGGLSDSIGEFLLTLTFDPPIPDEENPFQCFDADGNTDLLFPLDLPFVDIGQGADDILQSGDTLTFNLIESQPLGLGTTSCWQEAINSGAFESCIVLFINQINDSSCLDGGCDGLAGIPYPDSNTEDNTIIFSLTDACGGLPPPPILYGCTNPSALNFNPFATDDDGSCIFPEPIDPDPVEPDPFEVLCAQPSIFVPNTFTPNNDGRNDVFKVLTCAECFLEWHLLIFNRWGDLIWQTDDPNDVWRGEGRRESHFVPDGVYIYKIEAKGKIPSASQTLQGHITIFR